MRSRAALLLALLPVAAGADDAAPSAPRIARRTRARCVECASTPSERACERALRGHRLRRRRAAAPARRAGAAARARTAARRCRCASAGAERAAPGDRGEGRRRWPRRIAAAAPAAAALASPAAPAAAGSSAAPRQAAAAVAARRADDAAARARRRAARQAHEARLKSAQRSAGARWRRRNGRAGSPGQAFAAAAGTVSVGGFGRSRSLKPLGAGRGQALAGRRAVQRSGSMRTSASDRLSPPPRARWRALLTSISLASRGGSACTMAPSSLRREVMPQAVAAGQQPVAELELVDVPQGQRWVVLRAQAAGQQVATAGGCWPRPR